MMEAERGTTTPRRRRCGAGGCLSAACPTTGTRRRAAGLSTFGGVELERLKRDGVVDSWTTRDGTGASRRHVRRLVDGPSGIGETCSLARCASSPRGGRPHRGRPGDRRRGWCVPSNFLEEARGRRQREKLGKLHRRSLFCSLTGAVDHFGWGCRLRDTSTSPAAVAQGEVGPVEAFAPKVAPPAPRPRRLQYAPWAAAARVSVPSSRDKLTPIRRRRSTRARPHAAARRAPRPASPRAPAAAVARTPQAHGGRRRAAPARPRRGRRRAFDPSPISAASNAAATRICALAGTGVQASSDSTRRAPLRTLRCAKGLRVLAR